MTALLCLFLAAAVAAFSVGAASESFSVLRLRPGTAEELSFLGGLWGHSADLDVDFWQPPTDVGRDVDAMVSTGALARLSELLSGANVSSTLLIPDVEALIRRKEGRARGVASAGRRRYQDATGRGAPFNLAQFHSYPEMLRFMRELQQRYPLWVNTFSIGSTHEQRPLQLVKIGKSSPGGSVTGQKPSMWIDGGIHAREWVSPAAALYFIHQLATQYESDPHIRSLVDNIDWYILPVVNPDGYEYSRSSTNPRVRLWRKNRSPAQCRRSYNFFQGERCCQGVDLNRNFNFHFGGEGSSSDPCEEIYKGVSAFSEPESRAIRDFVSRPGMNFQGFITMHSYSQIWMYPYGHKRREYPADVADLKRVALKARAALQSLYGTKYEVGTGADTLYPASGGSDDWAKDGAGVKFVYLLELRPEDHVWDGFILDQREILPTAKETWAGVKIVAQEIMTRAGLSPLIGNSIIPPSVQSVVESEDCRDDLSSCPQWAQHNGCSVWRGLSQTCRLSCGICTLPRSDRGGLQRLLPTDRFQGLAEELPRDCSDRRSDCANWGLMGLCNWVRKSCAATCHFCRAS